MASKRDFRVLHTAGLLKPTSGMLMQMKWELEAARQLGINWDVKMYCPSNAIIKSSIVEFDRFIDATKINSKIAKLFAWIFFRFRYHNWLFSLQNDVDVYILRYYVHDPFQLWFALRSKKPVYFIHHSLEVPELGMSSDLVSIIRSNLEAFIGRFTLSASKGLICVTKEILDYEKKRSSLLVRESYIYPNGIRYAELSLTDLRATTTPELLFVANFMPWHGLDLLLSSVKCSQRNFLLHIVGNVSSDLLDIVGDDDRVIFHGKLNHLQIMDLGRKCWIGLSSFALNRKNMNEACPLKVREYLLMGLPVYGDCKDVFPEPCLFYKIGSDSIDEILEFAIDSRPISKSFVLLEARKYIEKDVLLNNLYSSLVKANQPI